MSDDTRVITDAEMERAHAAYAERIARRIDRKAIARAAGKCANTSIDGNHVCQREHGHTSQHQDGATYWLRGGEADAAALPESQQVFRDGPLGTCHSYKDGVQCAHFCKGAGESHAGLHHCNGKVWRDDEANSEDPPRPEAPADDGAAIPPIPPLLVERRYFTPDSVGWVRVDQLYDQHAARCAEREERVRQEQLVSALRRTLRLVASERDEARREAAELRDSKHRLDAQLDDFCVAAGVESTNRVGGYAAVVDMGRRVDALRREAAELRERGEALAAEVERLRALARESLEHLQTAEVIVRNQTERMRVIDNPYAPSPLRAIAESVESGILAAKCAASPSDDRLRERGDELAAATRAFVEDYPECVVAEKPCRSLGIRHPERMCSHCRGRAALAAWDAAKDGAK